MLALKLRPKEIIRIGDAIVLHADRSLPSAGVLIGIEAPRKIEIRREKRDPHDVEPDYPVNGNRRHQ